jgi:hypothetical protein
MVNTLLRVKLLGSWQALQGKLLIGSGSHRIGWKRDVRVFWLLGPLLIGALLYLGLYTCCYSGMLGLLPLGEHWVRLL